MLNGSEPVHGDTDTTDDPMSAHSVSMSVNVQFARMLLQCGTCRNYKGGWANFL